jgi:hypothetical protein
MRVIELEFLTDDERARELARQYWEVNEKGAFVYTLTALGEALGTPSSQVLRRVVATCTAYHEEECCPRCYAVRPFTSRTDYSSRQRYPHVAPTICQACRNAEATEKRQANDRVAALLRARVQAEFDSKKERGLRLEQLSLTDALYLWNLAVCETITGSRYFIFCADGDWFFWADNMPGPLSRKLDGGPWVIEPLDALLVGAGMLLMAPRTLPRDGSSRAPGGGKRTSLLVRMEVLAADQHVTR